MKVKLELIVELPDSDEPFDLASFGDDVANIAEEELYTWGETVKVTCTRIESHEGVNE